MMVIVMGIASLIIGSFFICIRLFIVCIGPFIKLLWKTGFIVPFLYLLIVMYLNYFTDLKADQSIPDYFHLGLTTLDDYVYAGFKVCLIAGCMIFVYRVIRFIYAILR